MSADVEVRDITKSFGAVRAVDGISLTVRAGEFLTLLGPSGCGKTTLLRLIAGFDVPDSGAVLIGGEDVTHQPPRRRNVNQVFQSYALFPHLSVRENIAFGLRMQRRPAREIASRVDEILALVALESCADRRPRELSGGQQQRVALGRALAPEPAVLLLDEPLSALDASLRESMQLELKRLQRSVGSTFILVTHDQQEALAMSDRIALIRAGRIEQCGDVREIYHQPATAFAAEFIGHTNLLEADWLAAEGEFIRVRVGGSLDLRVPRDRWVHDARKALVSIRPEKIRLQPGPAGGGGENVFAAEVRAEFFRGAIDRLAVRSEGGVSLDVLVTGGSAFRLPYRVGDRVFAAIHPDDIVVLESGTKPPP